jgi:hypothetical protein
LHARLGQSHQERTRQAARRRPIDDQTIAALRIAVAHLADVVVPKAASGARESDEVETGSLKIYEQIAGARSCPLRSIWADHDPDRGQSGKIVDSSASYIE